MVRAIRGATTAESNSREEILAAAGEMVKEMISKNGIDTEDMISILFTLTPDLDAVYPAVAVREMGITDVPLLDFAQPDVNGSLKKCIRAMIYINSDKSNKELKHIYLKGARVLRPDLVKGEDL
ncbi:MAG: chorismate mutase [Clostridiales bacterium]|nr:chorismate mutase [Clostridiales bacterium]